MICLMFYQAFYCTLYSVKTDENEVNRIKTIIVNTNKNILINAHSKSINVEEFKRNILTMPDEEYNKLIFTENYKKYLDIPCIIIVANLSKDCFSSKKNLILCGCRDIYSIGTFYFCNCGYNKCGTICENEKNHLLLNILILICIIALLKTLNKKVKKIRTFVNRNLKQKLD